ncbi:histidine phosphatase family protein [Fibrobacter sp. UWB10]|uniref:histidine phosphatase family protein n=1 Tax=Fibrobacter sp. UWB10 TaxID=1896201 RepID=UPI002402E358|nr:histidine phosphatase family protein [Fibrobacter sp. UWB10]SMP47128.1 Histidine phosphatase superfamily (branch 2) [Fibrobacter sp. UWB10]
MKKTAFLLFLAVACFAQTDSIKNEITKDFRKMGSNYYAYPTPTAKYTKAPAGYKPFYLSHYGRHGSRFHQPADHYHALYNTLAKADSLGKLSDLGKSLLERAKYLDEYAAPRAGDLTQLGVAQHQGIAKRMVKNFPEVFKNDAYIEAYASTSVRCVVSMAAFLEELHAQKPKVEIHQESGKYLMSFISPLDFGKIINESNTPAWQKENEKIYSHVNPTRMMRAIFNDSNYIKKNVDAGDLFSKIYEIGNSLQGSPEIEFSFDDLWTAEEFTARWHAQNAWWYSVLGNNPFAKKQGLENARPLLKNVLDEADKVIAADTTKANKTAAKPAKKTTATLRFGHDTVIIPFAVLLQLENGTMNTGIETADMENLHKVWRDYEITPMAANVQFIFYKSAKRGSPILVKVMLNEIEQKLPVTCDSATIKNCPAAPYYRWDDVREFYRK